MQAGIGFIVLPALDDEGGGGAASRSSNWRIGRSGRSRSMDVPSWLSETGGSIAQLDRHSAFATEPSIDMNFGHVLVDGTPWSDG